MELMKTLLSDRICWSYIIIFKSIESLLCRDMNQGTPALAQLDVEFTGELVPPMKYKTCI